jgi:hypothetical protein
VGQLGHLRAADGRRRTLQGVGAAEDLLDQLGFFITSRLLELDQAFLNLLQQFIGLGQENSQFLWCDVGGHG